MAAHANKVAAGESAQRTGLADQIASAVLLPMDVARKVLPANEPLVYLGVGALALFDVIGWPAAAATGVGYFLVRRWRPEAAR